MAKNTGSSRQPVQPVIIVDVNGNPVGGLNFLIRGDVQFFSLLPAANLHAGFYFIVYMPEGTFLLGTKKRAGLYRSDGVVWTRMGNLPLIDSITTTENVWSATKIAAEIAAGGGGSGIPEEFFTATNSQGSTITEGQPVKVLGSGTVNLAQADTRANSRAIGLVKDASIANSASGDIQTDGVLEVSDWTSVLGSASLTAGVIYYLDDATSGKIRATAPSGSGKLIVQIGTAISGTGLEMNILTGIKKA